jgi:hypothetical protein
MGFTICVLITAGNICQSTVLTMCGNSAGPAHCMGSSRVLCCGWLDTRASQKRSLPALRVKWDRHQVAYCLVCWGLQCLLLCQLLNGTGFGAPDGCLLEAYCLHSLRSGV